MSSELKAGEAQPEEGAAPAPSSAAWLQTAPVGGSPSDLAKLRREVASLRAALAVERERAEEFAHRNRNMLGVVSALGRRALADAPDLTAARDALETLLQRLAVAHDAGQESVIRTALETPDAADLMSNDLRGLVEATLRAFDIGAETRITVEGPCVAVDDATARLLPMLFFELATNALKHGALRLEDGCVSLTWRPLPDGALQVRWQEETADGTAAPPDRSRGGNALMRAVRESLDASLDWQLHAGECRMELTLPAHRCRLDAIPVPDPETHPSPQEAMVRPHRVLVVEDNPLIADDLAMLVRGTGVPFAATAFTLAEAQARLEAEPFDLVLLDLTLGADSAEALLPLLAGTEVVLVSGRSPDDLPEAFAGRPLLAKPFQPQDVAAILDAWRGPDAPTGRQPHPAGASGQSTR